ncbi:MAG: glycosyltransferase family 4 protein [Candidatus Acidiferrales bacterium]
MIGAETRDRRVQQDSAERATLKRRPKLAVVSPFLDKRHGTERPVTEWLNRAPDAFEIHVYSQYVEDLDLSRITWHRIPTVPGPHLINYLWWFIANHLWRAWDRRLHGLRFDLVYSPGINCLDADLISVHIMFAELLRRNLSAMRFRKHSVLEWPRLMHRRLYYALIVKLERRAYPNPKIGLIVISQRVSDGLQDFYGRKSPSPVVYFGLDHEIFNPKRCFELREAVRRQLQVIAGQFALLLIGNDWLNKGLMLLLEAMDRLRDLPLQLLVIGQDDPSPYGSVIRAKSLADRVHFLPPRKDVEFYYAASDVYVGPSKEDALPLPPAEAMACGLPVIVTTKCGVSEIIVDGENGLIMEDPYDAEDLATKIRQLYEDAPLRQRIGEKAAETARQYTWDRSAREFGELLLQTLKKKNPVRAAEFQQEI